MKDRKHSMIPIAVLLLFVACTGNQEERQEEAAGAPGLPPDLESATPRVALETSLGRIVLELDRDRAPQTVENFLFHVENDFYDTLTFHRVMPGFMRPSTNITRMVGFLSRPDAARRGAQMSTSFGKSKPGGMTPMT